MSNTKKERYLKGPENKTWNVFKGKRVNVFDLAQPDFKLQGVLVWVDVYTFGLQTRSDQDTPCIIYKGPGLVISLSG